MSATAVRLRGVVRNGVIVPVNGVALVEGAEVEFEVLPLPFSPKEREEFAPWEAMGDDAWAMIDEWEREEHDATR